MASETKLRHARGARNAECGVRARHELRKALRSPALARAAQKALSESLEPFQIGAAQPGSARANAVRQLIADARAAHLYVHNKSAERAVVIASWLYQRVSELGLGADRVDRLQWLARALPKATNNAEVARLALVAHGVAPKASHNWISKALAADVEADPQAAPTAALLEKLGLST